MNGCGCGGGFKNRNLQRIYVKTQANKRENIFFKTNGKYIFIAKTTNKKVKVGGEEKFIPKGEINPDKKQSENKMEGQKGKFIFGISKVGEKGQIVIPVEARKAFNIKAGDSLIVLGDIKKGIALVKADEFTSVAEDIIGRNNG